MKIHDLLIENCYNSKKTDAIENLANLICSELSTPQLEINIHFDGGVKFYFDGDDIDSSESDFIKQELTERFHEEFNHRIKDIDLR